jgi:hypothetical protein
VAAAAYERTLRMALELRPSEPPPFDRVVLELSSTGRLGALGADDWERADDARLARPVAVGDPGVVLTPLSVGAARCLLVLALGGATRATRPGRASPPTSERRRCWRRSMPLASGRRSTRPCHRRPPPAAGGC